MRTKTIVDGFKNSQKLRVIWNTNGGSENAVGLYLTIQQLSDCMATACARGAVFAVIEQLASDRKKAVQNNDPVPSGLLTRVGGFDVQVDVM